ncbi:tetratricopeptide repeat protein [Actinoallomurus sp. CA-150999]|uniref:tetratricopeptide repeat protein n=1 Tax=Actinoallomurus sp. CA-150999 TaxID=3239887 RepID=UPI003D94AD02
MTISPNVGGLDEPAVRQDMSAHRDIFASVGPMTINGHPPMPADRRAGGRGLLWPPLGRLPAHVRGRDVLVGRLCELVTAPDGRAHALAGMGGTGKSTVALQVAEAALAEDRPVWWVPGVDAASLTSTLLGLAQALGADAAAVEAARAGRADACDVLWEQLEARPGWVLVIDNADDLRVLGVAGRRVRDGNGWVRGSRAGLVIVTSRNGDMRRWGRAVELHPVGWLSDEDGGRVLLDLAPQAGDRADAEALSERLGGLALALHHAGSQLGSPFSATRTFAGYHAALEAEGPAVWEPPEAADEPDGDREVVTRTWEVSLEQLARAGVPQARGLLGVLARFAGAVPIPTGGLDHQVLGRVCENAGSATVAVGLEALLSVGLIQMNASPGAVPVQASSANTVTLHPLVTETVRHQLGSGIAGRMATIVAVELLAAATDELNSQDPRDWPVWSTWLPHLEELLTTTSTQLEEPSLATLASAAANAAMTLLWAGSYTASRTVAETALQHTQRLGTDHRATIQLRKQQAGAYSFSGDPAKAERLFRDLLQTLERVLDPDHPVTLTTRYEIARMVAEQGNPAEAERLYRDLLQTLERVLDPDHPNTLNARSQIAWMVVERGNPAEAERLYRDLLQTEKRVLGPDHPVTLNTRGQIARMVAEKGDPAEAERLFRDLLPALERVLDPDHPVTLTARSHIARMVAVRGNPAEAERLFRDLIQTLERVLDPDHPVTLTTRYEIARMVAEQGNPAEADRLYRDLLQTEKRVLGPDHPNTRITERELRALTTSAYKSEDE